MEVTVKTDDYHLLRLYAETLEVATLVASIKGYHLDIEPMAGSVKVTATNDTSGAVIRCNGASVAKAAEKLIKLLTES